MKKTISNMSKKSKMIAATAFVLGMTMVGAGAARAATVDNSSIHNDPFSDVVSAIATKFGLSEADVQIVVDQVMEQKRTEMEAVRKSAVADRLAQAVTDGKITQTQADLIKAKMLEVKNTMQSRKAEFSKMTDKERKAAMDKDMTDMKAWMTENNIPADFMPFGGIGGGHPGKMMSGGPKMMNR